jgi:RNA polymerase sigma-32 factor
MSLPELTALRSRRTLLGRPQSQHQNPARNLVAKKKTTPRDSTHPVAEVVDTEGVEGSEEVIGEADFDSDEDDDNDEPSDEELEEDLNDEFGSEGDEFNEEGSELTQASRALVRAAYSDTALSPLDPLAAYMREVQRHPLLTREEEHQLAVLYHETGDVDAAKKLVTSNLRLVVKIAYEYKRAYKNMMDLVQEGNIGLMQAVKHYDPHRGVKLSSYSAWWIRAYILRFILNNWRLVKLGTTQAQRKLFFNLNKERARLAAMGIEPTHEEIAKRLEVDPKEVRDMDLRLSAGDASLDVPVGEGDGTTSRLDLLRSAAEGPEVQVSDGQVLNMLREHLSTFRDTLAGKDLVIFDRRMVAEDPVTLQELGEEFGVSRERVRQLESRISGKLRVFLQECLGDAIDAEPS